MFSIRFEGKKGILHVYARTRQNLFLCLQQNKAIRGSLETLSCPHSVGVHVGLADRTEDLQKTHVLLHTTANWEGYSALLMAGVCTTVLHFLCRVRDSALEP